MARNHTRSGLGAGFAVRLASSSDKDLIYDGFPRDPEGELAGSKGNLCLTPKGVFYKTRGENTKVGWERLVTEDEIKDLVVSDYSTQIDALIDDKVAKATANLTAQIEELKARLDEESTVTLPIDTSQPPLDSVAEGAEPNPPAETAAQRKAREKAEKAAQEAGSGL